MDNSTDLNWPVIILVGLGVIILIIFLTRRNLTDKKDMEETMNQVDKRPEHEANDDSKI